MHVHIVPPISFANIKSTNNENKFFLDQDLLILSNGGLADNPQLTHCLSQLRKIALQKKS